MRKYSHAKYGEMIWLLFGGFVLLLILGQTAFAFVLLIGFVGFLVLAAMYAQGLSPEQKAQYEAEARKRERKRRLDASSYRRWRAYRARVKYGAFRRRR